MPTFRTQFLSLLREGEDDLRAAFALMAERIERLLSSAMDADGGIPVSRWRALEDQIAALLLTYFVDVDANHVPVAFTVNADGTLRPQSAYMRLLWRNIQDAAKLAVEQQAVLLKRSLKSESDIRYSFGHASVSPFLAMALEAFQQYEPPQRREIGGRVLSDRVLVAGFETQRKVRLLVRQLLSSDPNARDVSAALTRWLTEKLPDGSNGRFDAARLLRGETTYAYGSIGVLTSTLNPFITEIEWVLHPSHHETDDCDEAARGSPYQADTLPPYPSHANCLCWLRYKTHRRTVATVDLLRGDPERLRVRGALSPGFVDLLLRERSADV